MNFITVSNRREVAAKDAVKKALEVATSASTKATHYHKGEDQANAIKETVEILGKIGAELPVIVAAQPGTQGSFIQEVVLQDLERGNDGVALFIDGNDWPDLRKKAESALLAKLSNEAGLPYVLRMFEEARRRRINNRRTQGAIVATILNLKALEFDAVKYRTKLRNVLEHAWGRGTTSRLVDAVVVHLRTGTLNAQGFDVEARCISRYTNRSIDYIEPIIAYIFGVCEPSFVSDAIYPVISNALRARTSIDGISNVPVEVLFGLLSRPEHPQHESLWKDPEKRKETQALLMQASKSATDNQKMRESSRRAKLGVNNQADTGKVTDVMALAKTLIENGNTNKSAEIEQRLDEIAKSSATLLPYQRVGVIFDNSISMSGDSRESKNTPRAVALMAYKVIEQSLLKSGAAWSRIDCGGYSTNLVRGFIDLLKTLPKPDCVFVISDGYENNYDGALEDAVSAYRRNVENIPVIHLSPIGAAEVGGAMRPLSVSGDIVSVPANWRSFKSMIDSRMLEINFRGWLQREAEALLESSNSKPAKRSWEASRE